ncbi:MAG TPA: acyl-CoA dehydrogenase family protein [Acidimicrobiales bacterium]|nr:acyl-CoA dehydrogenase family protein [Acidimicrobiales bacterium]
MDYDFGAGAGQLRARLRQLMAEQLPPDFVGAFTHDPADLEVAQRFCKTLGSEGLLALAWPKKYGGGGGSVWDQTVVREEMWAHYEPRGAQYMGINWVGPAIIRFGTPEQQAKHLPLIASGDVIWCQGFSEPEAGSDLASLRTRALPTDSGWRITGQKIWTSYAEMAQWCVLAARTTPGPVKQQGITIFLLPLDREGITIRPIANFIGPDHFNEVFLDDVPVTQADVLGEVDAGWGVIRTALAFERTGIARYARCERLLSLVRDAYGSAWDALPPAHRTRWVRAQVHVRVARLLAYRAIDQQGQQTDNDTKASVARISATLCDQEVAELLTEMLGTRPLPGREEEHRVLLRAVDDHWRNAQAATVASGTIEIQRMLVSRAALRSPRARALR